MSATRKKSGGLKKSAPIETRSNDPRIQYAEELAAEAFDNMGSEARSEVHKRSRDKRSSGLTTKSEGDVAWNSSTSVRDGAWDMQGRLDEIANWSAALGPMSYKLGKAKVAMQLFRNQVEEKQKKIEALEKELGDERDDHDYTRMKLLAQEQLFMDALIQAKSLEVSTISNEHVESVFQQSESFVHKQLRERLSGVSEVGDISGIAKTVTASIMEDVAAQIKKKDAERGLVEEKLDTTSQALEECRRENDHLRDLLQSMTQATSVLEDKMQGVVQKNENLRTEMKGMELQTTRLLGENRDLSDSLGRQTQELEEYVGAIVREMRKKFGYVPPALKLAAFFGTPAFRKVNAPMLEDAIET